MYAARRSGTCSRTRLASCSVRRRSPTSRLGDRGRFRQNGSMRITAKADYAVRAAAELAAAQPDGAPVKGEHLAKSQGIPQNFLENILTELRRAGIVRTRRGADGGYQLARPAAEITVADVLRAVEGPARRGAGHAAPRSSRTTGAAEHLPEVWIALRASLRSVLENVTLADLASGKLPRAVASKSRRPRRLDARSSHTEIATGFGVRNRAIAASSVARTRGGLSPSGRARRSRSSGRDRVVLERAPQLRGGTVHITSNSMPSGSCAYSDLLTPWSLSPTSAPSRREPLAHRRRGPGSCRPPTRGGRGRRGRARGRVRAAPIENRPRSWWLSVSAARMNTRRAVADLGDDLEAERLAVERGARGARRVRRARRGSDGVQRSWRSQPPESFDDSREHFHESVDVGVGRRPADRDAQRVIGVDAHRGEHRRRFERLRRARRSRVHRDAVLVEREQDRLGLDAVDAEAQQVRERAVGVGVAEPLDAGDGVDAPSAARVDQRALRAPPPPPTSTSRARRAEARPTRARPRCPPRRARSCAPPTSERRDAQPAAHEQRARALRAAQLVRGHRAAGRRRARRSRSGRDRPPRTRRRARARRARVPPRTHCRGGLQRSDLVVARAARDTSTVSSRIASSTSAASNRPSRSTPTTVHVDARPRDRVAHARVLDRGRDDVPARRAGTSRDAPQTAVFTDSVPDDVNTTSRGRAPRNAATCSRASSSATRVTRPSACSRPGSAW